MFCVWITIIIKNNKIILKKSWFETPSPPKKKQMYIEKYRLIHLNTQYLSETISNNQKTQLGSKNVILFFFASRDTWRSVTLQCLF